MLGLTPQMYCALISRAQGCASTPSRAPNQACVILDSSSGIKHAKEKTKQNTELGTVINNI